MSGRDTRGKGGAEGTVVSTMHPLDGGGTRVEMNTDLRFSGQVAQLGRPGVVQDVSNRLVDQFAACIKAQLSATPEEAT
jgi:carbon monoxide dehydrogenase subunit G